MAIAKEPEIKGAKKPILLRGTGQSLCLEVKIGNLGVELWDFPNEEAQPYARLVLDQVGEERREGAVTLNWQQCFALSGAIQEWLLYLESGIEEHHEPALHMELGSFTCDFYRQSMGQGPRMICALEIESSLPRQVTLTRSEASLLGRLLFCLGDNEAEQMG